MEELLHLKPRTQNIQIPILRQFLRLGLDPSREPWLARPDAGKILAVKVGENDFMSEERNPIECSRTVGVSSANKLVPMRKAM